MTITVNGQPREIESGTTLTGLLEEMGLEPRLVAVERKATTNGLDNSHLHSVSV